MGSSLTGFRRTSNSSSSSFCLTNLRPPQSRSPTSQCYGLLEFPEDQGLKLTRLRFSLGNGRLSKVEGGQTIKMGDVVIDEFRPGTTRPSVRTAKSAEVRPSREWNKVKIRQIGPNGRILLERSCVERSRDDSSCRLSCGILCEWSRLRLRNVRVEPLSKSLNPKTPAEPLSSVVTGTAAIESESATAPIDTVDRSDSNKSLMARIWINGRRIRPIRAIGVSRMRAWSEEVEQILCYF